jgi:hypothetical protein
MPFFVGRLTPLATDRVRKSLDMSHISIGAAGLTQTQIDAVPLQGAVLPVLWKWIWARLLGARA